MMHSGYLQCWCRKQSLAADIPALVHGLSDMLLEGRTCWWYISWTLFFLANSLQRALLTSVENEFRSLFNLLATILMIFLKKQLIKFGA